MIRHTIAPFKEDFLPWHHGRSQFNNSNWGGSSPRAVPPPQVAAGHVAMGKLEYSTFRDNLKYNPGDLVDVEWGTLPDQFTTWKIISIEEVHHLLMYNPINNEPKPYYMMSQFGVSRYGSEKEIRGPSTMDKQEWQTILERKG